jgi:hypothetical protein
VRRKRTSLEERVAWDQYAAAWTAANSRKYQQDSKDDSVAGAHYADALLQQRRKRFGRVRRKPVRRRKPSVH